MLVVVSELAFAEVLSGEVSGPNGVVHLAGEVVPEQDAVVVLEAGGDFLGRFVGVGGELHLGGHEAVGDDAEDLGQEGGAGAGRGLAEEGEWSYGDAHGEYGHDGGGEAVGAVGLGFEGEVVDDVVEGGDCFGEVHQGDGEGQCIRILS